MALATRLSRSCIQCFRVSLFTLLACVTCIGVALGIVRHRAEQQKQAVAWILDQGGEVRFTHYRKLVTDVYYSTGSDEDKAQRAALRPDNSWLADTLGEHYVHHVESLTFHECKFDGEAWRLAHAYGAKSMVFWKCNLTAEVLAALGDCSGLENLTVVECDWDQSALSHLASLPRLKTLDVREMPLEKGLEHLGKCRNVELLDLTYSRFEPDDFEKLRPLTKLLQCGVGFTSVGDDQLDVIAGWPQLKRLELGEHVTDAGLAKLAGSKNLESLIFMKSPVTDAGIVKLVALPKLHSLQLSDCRLSDELIMRLSKEEPHWEISYVR